MTKILTASQLPNVRRAGGYRAYVERLVRERWDDDVDWTAAGEPVRAWVNRSHWVADCPTRGCRGSIVVDPAEPYFCPDCENAGNLNRARLVTWPPEREEIERILLNRPSPYDRNWMPDWTLEFLRTENAANGDAV